MIKVRNIEIKPEFFTDSTMKIKLKDCIFDENVVWIEWAFDNESELVLLQYITMFIKDFNPNATLTLRIYYMPNARMDRVENLGHEVHTLKYCTKIINSLGFSAVSVFDPHSNVTKALLDHYVESDSPEAMIKYVIKQMCMLYDIFESQIILAFPDKGAMDRYSKLINELSLKYVYGAKQRDWNTRDIVTYELVDPFSVCMHNAHILICDDIISTGGTIASLTRLLNKEKIATIDAYCSHLENEIDKESNVLRQKLNTGELSHIFTTDSIYKAPCPMLSAISKDSKEKIFLATTFRKI